MMAILGENMKPYLLPLTAVSTLFLTACASTSPAPQKSNVTAPTVVRSPDFRNLPTTSCKNGEYIHTPVVLALNKQGEVTQVSGIKVKDKQLAYQIGEQFKKAKYTPYLKDGVPISHHLNVAISLKCPTKRR